LLHIFIPDISSVCVCDPNCHHDQPQTLFGGHSNVVGSSKKRNKTHTAHGQKVTTDTGTYQGLIININHERSKLTIIAMYFSAVVNILFAFLAIAEGVQSYYLNPLVFTCTYAAIGVINLVFNLLPYRSCVGTNNLRNFQVVCMYHPCKNNNSKVNNHDSGISAGKN
jgi:hypothetical protein